jgi:hypothetical protein
MRCRCQLNAELEEMAVNVYVVTVDNKKKQQLLQRSKTSWINDDWKYVQNTVFC